LGGPALFDRWFVDMLLNPSDLLIDVSDLTYIDNSTVGRLLIELGERGVTSLLSRPVESGEDWLVGYDFLRARRIEVAGHSGARHDALPGEPTEHAVYLDQL